MTVFTQKTMRALIGKRQAIRSFCRIALSRPVVVRATRIAMVVGIILAAINHGDRLFSGDIDLATGLKVLLTFCVPYSVSTYSSVIAIRQFYSAENAGAGHSGRSQA